jgi:hypothetical protein
LHFKVAGYHLEVPEKYSDAFEPHSWCGPRLWATLKPRRCRVLAHARRLGRQRECGAAFGRTRDQVWQEPAKTRQKDRKLDPTSIGGPPRVVGTRWNQPWNFSRLLKHLTEHRMSHRLVCEPVIFSLPGLLASV